MDAECKNFADPKTKVRRNKCAVCEIPGQKLFVIPSDERYTYNIAKRPGFCQNLVKCLRSQTTRMSDSDRLCNLLIDEMSIKPGLSYDKDRDCILGFTTIDNDSKQEPRLATEALVFMARGIVTNWKQILGYQFTSSSESLMDLVHEAIEILHSCDLEVVSIVCDQGPMNQSLFKELKITKEEPFFLHNSTKIFAMYDPPHLLKSTRNNLKNHGIFYQDKIASVVSRNLFADWKHIKQLYEMDSKKEISACRRLTKRHIEVSGLSKMNVKLAAQVLSHSVAAALNLYINEGLDSKASETSQFVFKMDKLFDSVNARTCKSEKQEMCAVSENSVHLKLWKEAIVWIETWHVISSKTKKELYIPSKKGWLITLNALIAISEFLLKKVKYILTGRFCQDALENTFSSIRRRGGFRDHPDVNEFCSTIHKVIISNFLKRSCGKNCQDDGACNLIDFSCFNGKELTDIINSEDSVTESVIVEESIQNEGDNVNFDSVQENVLSSVSGYFEKNDLSNENKGKLDNTEENVLSYISGYLAKKYLSCNECKECEKLIVDKAKILRNHTVFLYFKEYDDLCKSGLKWPTDNFFNYFVILHQCFMSSFHLFVHKNDISKNLVDVLSKVDVEFLNDHLEHKEKAQFFFISTFVKMMIRHKIKMHNNNYQPVAKSRNKKSGKFPFY